MWPKKNKERAEDAMKPDMHDSEADQNTPNGDQGAESPMDSELESLRDRIAQLEEQNAQLNQDKLRTIADYQNFAKRAQANEKEAKTQGTTAIVLNVIPVLDHFDLALGQDLSKVSAEQIASGVKVIRDELLRVLQRHGVTLIEPVPGEEFDPHRHQAVTQMQDDAIPPGHIVRSLQTGYALNERVIRPASVAVRPNE
jgi:molecular chaperone GrpE